MKTTPPISALYVHVPFCHTICGYCDFYSEVLDPERVAALVDALLAELAEWRSHRDITATTIFVGGGTPTTLPPAELSRLLLALRDLSAGGDLEFTVEANPATVTPAVARVLAAAGVTRVSVGAQSFDPGELRVLERIHRPDQVRQTVENARAAGIRELNLDLIFAVPGQSLASWLASLREALALSPDHLSCYGLTYERGTPLQRQLELGQVRRLGADAEAAMYESTIDTLAAAGFEHYEISNFARPGRRCRHNLVYWHNRPYLGIGPSAAGYVDGLRYKNIPDTAQYLRTVAAFGSPISERERLDLAGQARETAMLELRLIEGIGRAEFQSRFGIDPSAMFAAAIGPHSAAGLLSVDASHIRLTRAGLLLADSVIADFLVSPAAASRAAELR